MAEGKLEVVIVTPEGKRFQGEVDEIVAPGFKGQFGALPSHIPMLTSNQPGLFIAVTGSTREIWAVGSGFIEVGPSSVQLIVQSAERAQDIDVARAENARVRALAELEKQGYNRTAPEFEQAELRLKRAEARLEAASAK